MSSQFFEQPVHIPLKAFRDNRGFFFESYNKKTLETLGIKNTFCQDNFSFSQHKGTIRGLHFQSPPFDQAKIVLPLQGSIFDVVIDIRKNSPTFLKVETFVLEANNPSCLYVPKGYAHGFCTLEDNVSVLYKVDQYYSPQHDGGIVWDDPQFKIDWPLKGQQPILSEKDGRLPLFNQQKLSF